MTAPMSVTYGENGSPKFNETASFTIVEIARMRVQLRSFPGTVRRILSRRY